MDFLGVGPLELIFIFLIALIVLGPNDMVKTGRTLGRFLRKIVTSPAWHTIRQTSRDLRYLPNKLIREAGMEEGIKELNQLKDGIKENIEELRQIRPEIDFGEIEEEIKKTKEDLSAWTTPPTIASPPPPSLERDQLSEPPNSNIQTQKDEA